MIRNYAFRPTHCFAMLSCAALGSAFLFAGLQMAHA